MEGRKEWGDFLKPSLTHETMTYAAPKKLRMLAELLGN